MSNRRLQLAVRLKKETHEDKSVYHRNASFGGM
jgi:hypothetical protein